MNTPRFAVAVSFVLLGLWAGTTAAQTAEKAFAKVGDEVVTLDEFTAAYEGARRKRYYHGAPRADQQQEFRREVAEDLITRVLLLQEARRLNLKPDHSKIAETLGQYDRRYAANPKWKQERERWLAALRIRAEENDLLQQLEAQVRQAAPPSKDQLLAYYRSNRDKFAEPPRTRVSLILLAVEPSSQATVWQAARKEAEKLVADLRRGADFAELARLHSGDAATAQRRGDMGYLHAGMLSPQAEQAIAKLAPGAIADPVTVLEGIAIFRLDERQAARQNSFEETRERVAELWRQEQGDRAWQALQQRLHSTTAIEIYDTSLRPLLSKQRGRS